MPKCEGDHVRNYYKYYDSPDGCEIPQKIMCCVRYGAAAGLVLGTYDVLMYSRVVGMVPMLKRYLKHVAPLALMGATFAAVSNTVLRFRQRDDPLNYFFGGLACGPILAVYLGSAHAVVAGGIALGLIGVVKKESIDHKQPLFPVPVPMNLVNTWRHDWTIWEDPRDDMMHTCKPKKRECNTECPPPKK